MFRSGLTRRYRAITLMESLFYFALVGVIIVGIVGMYRNVAGANEVAAAQSKITSLAGGARRYYSASTLPGNLGGIVAKRQETFRLLEAGAFSQNDLDIALGNNGAVLVPSGTSPALTRDLNMNVFVYYDVNVDRIVVRFLGVPTGYCMNMFSEGLRSSGLFVGADVGDGSVPADSINFGNPASPGLDLTTATVADIHNLCRQSSGGKGATFSPRMNAMAFYVLP